MFSHQKLTRRLFYFSVALIFFDQIKKIFDRECFVGHDGEYNFRYQEKYGNGRKLEDDPSRRLATYAGIVGLVAALLGLLAYRISHRGLAGRRDQERAESWWLYVGEALLCLAAFIFGLVVYFKDLVPQIHDQKKMVALLISDMTTKSRGAPFKQQVGYGHTLDPSIDVMIGLSISVGFCLIGMATVAIFIVVDAVFVMWERKKKETEGMAQDSKPQQTQTGSHELRAVEYQSV